VDILVLRQHQAHVQQVLLFYDSNIDGEVPYWDQDFLFKRIAIFFGTALDRLPLGLRFCLWIVALSLEIPHRHDSARFSLRCISDAIGNVLYESENHLSVPVSGFKPFKISVGMLSLELGDHFG